MQDKSRGVYFGIELRSSYTCVSYYQLNMDSPETISTVMGAENYHIPTYIAKRRGVGQWYYGNEAKTQVRVGGAVGVDDLLSKAYDDDEILIENEKIKARDLLLIYIKKLLSMPGYFYANSRLNKLVIVVERLDMKIVDTFSYIAKELGIARDSLMVIDFKEAFYYYTLNQRPEHFLHDVVMFDYSDGKLMHYYLTRNLRTLPQIVYLSDGIHKTPGANPDLEFTELVERVFAGKIISAVYLIGDGFDGDWLKVSLNKLCHNRKVFKGKDMYSRGACYAGAVKDGAKDWPFVYIGDNELKMNLSIKVIDNRIMDYLTLLNAGDSWYEAQGECEVILDGSGELEVWIQKPENRDAKVEILELTDLPERDNRTTRLRINAKPVSDIEAVVTIADLGFGEIVPSSGKVWEHHIALR
ncbi:MAG: hypothetical protein K5644_04345 [Lachnospiraceae bacterium]|nr:hypothetical protein [Lachnospiraceae bacterium]